MASFVRHIAYILAQLCLYSLHIYLFFCDKNLSDKKSVPRGEFFTFMLVGYYRRTLWTSLILTQFHSIWGHCGIFTPNPFLYGLNGLYIGNAACISHMPRLKFGLGKCWPQSLKLFQFLDKVLGLKWKPFVSEVEVDFMIQT